MTDIDAIVARISEELVLDIVEIDPKRVSDHDVRNMFG